MNQANAHAKEAIQRAALYDTLKDNILLLRGKKPEKWQEVSRGVWSSPEQMPPFIRAAALTQLNSDISEIFGDDQKNIPRCDTKRFGEILDRYTKPQQTRTRPVNPNTRTEAR